MTKWAKKEALSLPALKYGRDRANSHDLLSVIILTVITKVNYNLANKLGRFSFTFFLRKITFKGMLLNITTISK